MKERCEFVYCDRCDPMHERPLARYVELQFLEGGERHQVDLCPACSERLKEVALGRPERSQHTEDPPPS